MRSTLERSLRKTIERTIRKSLKKLTNRKTKKKKRKTKRKKKLQRGGTVEDQELLIGIFNNKYLDGPSIKDNQFVLTTPITTRVGLNEAMQSVLQDYSLTQVNPVLGSQVYQASLGAQGSGNLTELDVRRVLALIFRAGEADHTKAQIGQMSVELSDFKVKGGGVATYQGLLREMSGELYGYYESLSQVRIAPVAAPVPAPLPVPVPVQQEQQGPELEPVPVQQGPELEPEQVAHPNRGLLYDPETGLASPVAEEDDEDQAAAAAKIQAAERGRQDRQGLAKQAAAATTIQSAERRRMAQEQRRLLEEERREVIAAQREAQQQAQQQAAPVVRPAQVPMPSAVPDLPGGGGEGPSGSTPPQRARTVGSNCGEINEDINILRKRINALEQNKLDLTAQLQAARAVAPGGGGGGEDGDDAPVAKIGALEQELLKCAGELEKCKQEKRVLEENLKKLIKELYCSILAKVRISRLAHPGAGIPPEVFNDIGLTGLANISYESVLQALLSDILVGALEEGLRPPGYQSLADQTPILTQVELNSIRMAEGVGARIAPPRRDLIEALYRHILLSRLPPDVGLAI